MIWVVTGRAPCPDFDAAIVGARAGDHEAFAVLWRWLQPSLVRWLNVVATDDVEDVASEVWMTVARSLPAFVGTEDGFRNWVFTVARRRAIDAGRRRRRRPPTCPLDGTEVVDHGSAFDDQVAGLESALALLRQLHPAQREVVALRVIVGLDVRETAAVVEKSEGAVRIACHRGLRALADQLSAELVEELVG
jgi:RNA polymerase sigma-70 factor (ECF subfamily)